MHFVGRTLADDTRSLRPTWGNTCAGQHGATFAPRKACRRHEFASANTTQPVAQMPMPEAMKQQIVVQFRRLSNSYFGL